MKILIKSLVITILLAGCSAQQINDFNNQMNYKAAGYYSPQDYGNAKEFPDMTPQRYADLKSYGIVTKKDLDDILNEMNSIQYYDDNYNYDAVFDYLKDEKTAGEKHLTITKVRDDRLEALRKQREKDREEFARTYPFKAIITCNINGQHTQPVVCFLKSQYGVDTNLEITNGDDYNLIKSYEIDRTYSVENNELIIPLKEHFSIAIQNSQEYYILNLKILDSRNGQTIFNKSAGMKYQSIGVTN